MIRNYGCLLIYLNKQSNYFDPGFLSSCTNQEVFCEREFNNALAYPADVFL